MGISLTRYKKQFLERTLNCLWQQWAESGAGGQVGADLSYIIDPEALLLATTTFGRFEPRLFDGMLEWLDTNGHAINLQRLESLSGSLGQRSILGGVAAHISKRTSNIKWRALVREAKPNIPAAPLFADHPVFGEVDELFARQGWRRERFEFRHLSQPPNPNRLSNLLFKLRALFGIQARAEVMAYLLSHESGYPAEMAQRLSYFPRTIQTTLNDMARSGHVFSGRERHEKRFWIRREEWAFLIKTPSTSGGDPVLPQWIDWAPRFSALEALWGWLDNPDLEKADPSVQAIELRACLEQLSPAFIRENMRISPNANGAAFIESVLESFEKVLEWTDHSTIAQRPR